MKKLDHMKMSQPEIARLMKEEMRARMLNNTDVARALGMTYDSAGGTVRKYINGETRASLRINYRMVEWLNSLPELTPEVAMTNGFTTVLQKQEEVDRLADAVADRIWQKLRKAMTSA